MARRCGPPAQDLPEVAVSARIGSRRLASPARLGAIAAIALLAVVAAIGAFAPAPVAGGAGPNAAVPTAPDAAVPTASDAATAVASAAVASVSVTAAATSATATAVPATPAPATAVPAAAAATAAATAAPSIIGAAWGGTGGIDIIDLVTKGGLVLILLFITLRVLGRMQSSNPRRNGRLNVLESRTLAAKASLHLVAVGDRRLVVGLTPSGMVALAELDAAELEDSQAETQTVGDGASTPAFGSGLPKPAIPQLPFAATLGALMAPIDGLTDKLAGFFSGGRTR
jgi:flagellar biogenesis protein FliO